MVLNSSQRYGSWASQSLPKKHDGLFQRVGGTDCDRIIFRALIPLAVNGVVGYPWCHVFTSTTVFFD